MIDHGFPTSSSVLWSWVKNNYTAWSVENWVDIPHVPTNSAWLVKKYANIIKELKLHTDKKIAVIEWGLGCGGFAYGLLEELDENILDKYLAFDLQESMPVWFSKHPQMRKHYQNGRVGFFVFDFLDAESWIDYIEKSFNLKDYCFVFVANYFIDSLPSDVWVSDKNGARPLSLEIESKGFKPIEKRALTDLEINLIEIQKYEWQVDEIWYKNLILNMVPPVKDKYIYNVPCAWIRVVNKIKSRLPNGLFLCCDIPLKRVSSSENVSPYFLDGMVASVVDFDLLNQAMKNLGFDLLYNTGHSFSLLYNSCYSFGLDGFSVKKEMDMASYLEIEKMIDCKNGEEWSFGQVLAYLEFVNYDPLFVDVLVNHAAGADIRNSPDIKKYWLSILSRIESKIFWVRNTEIYLHMSTLYRWQKCYDDAIRMLESHINFCGYNNAYWYCIGYLYFDQLQFAAAVEMWSKIIDDEYFGSVLQHDMNFAKNKINR